MLIHIHTNPPLGWSGYIRNLAQHHTRNAIFYILLEFKLSSCALLGLGLEHSEEKFKVLYQGTTRWWK
jgi:hypothetical protein